MEFLITQLREYKLLQEKEKEKEPYEKKSYWPSENSNCNKVIYWRWKGEKPSNPIDVLGLQIMSIGNKVEDQIVEDWEKMGILVPPPEGEDQHRIDIERFGIKITGKIDAIIKEKLSDKEEIQVPVEVKSFYGDYQERLITQLQPNISYLKQLAMYMDALAVNKGILYMVNRGNGKQFQLTLTQEGGKYKLIGINYDDEVIKKSVEKIEFNINDTYIYFAEVEKDVQANKLPTPASYQYKYPLTLEILQKQSASAISSARMGRAVLGDWQCKYCSYKDKCLKQQKIELGYTKEEQEKLIELTKGYTTKMWRGE